MPSPRRHASRINTSRVSRRRAVKVAGLGAATLAVAPHLRQGVAAAPQNATPTTTTAMSFSAADQVRFLTIVHDGLAATVTPGALVGVWSATHGNWTYGAGIGDLRTAVPVSLDDHVRIASNTKTFVATVVLQLVGEGALSLEDTLETYIADIPNGGEITIRQLLAMDAGIYDYVREPVIAIDYAADPTIAFTPDDALAIIRASTPDFAPGEELRYSNSNYVLLGFIIEQVTGQSVESEIETRILTPLGLRQTSFPRTSAMPEPYAHGYLDKTIDGALQDVSISNPDVGWAAGAMVSTLEDMHVWVRALATGALLSPKVQRERLMVRSIPNPTLEYGYGLGILQVNGLLGHNGGIAGYSSWMMHDPETDTSVVVVAMRGGEQGGTADPIFFGLAHVLFPDRFPDLAKNAATPAATPAP